MREKSAFLLFSKESAVRKRLSFAKTPKTSVTSAANTVKKAASCP